MASHGRGVPELWQKHMVELWAPVYPRLMVRREEPGCGDRTKPPERTTTRAGRADASASSDLDETVGRKGLLGLLSTGAFGRREL